MNDKVNGLVLSLNDYHENDVMMKVLTREYGILSFVGKAAKKLNSKNHFFPLCLYEFIIDYKDSHTMYTIHGNKLLKDYWSDSAFDLLNFKNILLELTMKNSEIPTYDELVFILDHIDDQNKFLLGSMYVSYLMREFGVTPMVDHCVMCDNTKVVAISNRHGGFLCQNHLQGEENLPVERLKRFRLLARADRSKYDLIKEISIDLQDFTLLLDFFLANSDMQLKTYRFYKNLY
ncbi:MAG: DNA repair protein RecO [Erysipelotrichaceae bacterium]|nr:DNA repair protein RecO [Erysipelotrichaceae bacterium]